MQFWIRLIGRVNKRQPILLVSILLMVVSCSTVRKPSPMWPTNLTVIELADGGLCLDRASAEKLAAFKAELESL
ncbi:hypothetical protein [Vibrio cholerae]|uniref:hypothetical protein n=1 Tax=Vibrio cholerae TaxID=666 RepID=UPI0013B443CE|nr:hypothetical protein [Vibrio cholerae]